MQEKLVRDNIPKIIEESGNKCEFRILSDEEYAKSLGEKLKEEVAEFIKEYEAENDEQAIKELADIQEVILAIVDMIGVEQDKFELIRKNKAKANGAFKNKISLKLN